MTFGLQLGYATSELKSRTDASQVTDPCFRARHAGRPVYPRRNVSDLVASLATRHFDATNFPPSGSVLAPKGAGVSERRTSIGIAKRFLWSDNGKARTKNGWQRLSGLKSETSFETEEFSILARVDNDDLFPVPEAGSTWEFDNNGIFQRGVLTQTDSGGYGSPYGGLPTGFLAV